MKPIKDPEGAKRGLYHKIASCSCLTHQQDYKFTSHYRIGVPKQHLESLGFRIILVSK